MERSNRDGPRDGIGKPLEVMPGNAAWIRRRERFYEWAIGPMHQPAVYHWEDDDDPHIDVYVLGATARRRHETMVTGGMADRPMPGVRAGTEIPRRVELLVEVPHSADRLAVILRQIAGVPFRYGVALTAGSLIMGTSPVRRGSALRHAILASCNREALRHFVVEGEIVEFLSVLFISDEELEYGRAMGGTALLRMLESAGVGRVLEVSRESVT